ncbi:heme-binding protein 1-like isoform X2 [Penaeus japonicus]|nr:heme-binding protein 1-like isoform X2 [Penaeus japonicus]XP_042872131.1 heme-binding protein 1-like isoform X2 [Penaeus japonicus]XP_042872132.1 heme-binding protein 1-like isoform X2 [Penaeus japonicus]
MGQRKMTMLVWVVGVLAALLQPTFAGSLIGAFSNSLGPEEIIEYEVVNEGDGFEERKIPSLNWACMEQQSSSSDADQMDVFFKLFGYLGGNNDQGARMNMAAPVSIEYLKNDTGVVLTGCFLVEKKHQTQPPVPTDSNIKIKVRPEMNVLTRKFGGYATSDSVWLRETAALKAILTVAGKAVRSDLMYWNAYDAPFKFWNRRNEVWLLEAV